MIWPEQKICPKYKIPNHNHSMFVYSIGNYFGYFIALEIIFGCKIQNTNSFSVSSALPTVQELGWQWSDRKVNITCCYWSVMREAQGCYDGTYYYCWPIMKIFPVPTNSILYFMLNNLTCFSSPIVSASKNFACSGPRRRRRRRRWRGLSCDGSGRNKGTMISWLETRRVNG